MALIELNSLVEQSNGWMPIGAGEAADTFPAAGLAVQLMDTDFLGLSGSFIVLLWYGTLYRWASARKT